MAVPAMDVTQSTTPCRWALGTDLPDPHFHEERVRPRKIYDNVL
jgi:hypothetical protein